MDEEMKEVFAEPVKDKGDKIDPFSYVTITVKEYKKLITKTVKKDTKRKFKAKYEAQLKEAEDNAEQYRRWWHEEQAANSELRKNLDAAKAQIKELLDIKEVKPDADDGR